MTNSTDSRSVTAMDSAEELLRAHLSGQQLGDEAKAGISSSLSEALRELHSQRLAAERGSDDAQQAVDGLQRFDALLRQIADAGLLPER